MRKFTSTTDLLCVILQEHVPMVPEVNDHWHFWRQGRMQSRQHRENEVKYCRTGRCSSFPHGLSHNTLVTITPLLHLHLFSLDESDTHH